MADFIFNNKIMTKPKLGPTEFKNVGELWAKLANLLNETKGATKTIAQ